MIKKLLYPFMSLITISMFIATLYLLGAGVADTRSQILISRQVNLVGRSQVIAEIRKDCIK